MALFACFKAYDPVCKFVSDNLGEVGWCPCCICCGYLSLRVPMVGKQSLAFTAFVSKLCLLILTRYLNVKSDGALDF